MSKNAWFDPSAPSRQVSRQRERLRKKGRKDTPNRWGTVRSHTTRFHGPGPRETGRWLDRNHTMAVAP